MSVHVLLWDADGVLQHGPRGWNWRARLDRIGGPGFADAVFRAELPALRGEARLADVLAEVLAERRDVPLEVDDLLGLWEMASVDEQAFAFVAELRASGIPCHLATNQQDHRRIWMRDELGYDSLFERTFYSCELGVAKPDPRFFEAILQELDLPASAVGFIDDASANVATAEALGIRTYHHPPAGGIAALRAGVQELLGEASASPSTGPQDG
ncbi:MAG TPA: HAD-IA family hydrolase [Phycicoccus sp.]|nr:HAD-IA family hydrolase [Phycicoccus sp.]HQH07888.1 HAD-IA family hydrolase [Phycicoccus sp.]HQY96605.1 HAD-IA family hydrolase [Phycicoccus sp.]HRA44324.1 HAD-IA family hydrolase [Phycicoccus sp.]